MKIGISCFPTSGGSGVVATELGLHLAARGHEVHFICVSPPFRSRRRELPPGVHFHPVVLPDYPPFEHSSYGLAAGCAMAQATARHALQVLHVHYALPHAVSAQLACQMLRRVPEYRGRPGATGVEEETPAVPAVVTTLHGTDITLVEQNRCHRDLVRFALNCSDALSAVSEFLAAETRRRFAPSRPIEVIPNFVDFGRFRPRPTRREPVEGREALLMHVTNFRPVKRPHDVIEVFQGVRRSRPARLLLIGEGPMRDEVRRRVEQLGLASCVEFLGEQAEVERFLTRSDVFLVASQLEGFGLAALEAMACGVPVVGTRCGGLEEVVGPEATRLLFAVGDREGMIRCVQRLLEDRALHRRLAASARRRAVEFFSPDRIVERYEALYEKTLRPETSVSGCLRSSEPWKP